MSIIKVFVDIIKIIFKLFLFLLESVFWIIFFIYQAIVKVIDLIRSIKSVKGGLHCPRGHEIPTTGGKYECSECGWVSESPIYECGNPECRAITPYINCPTCGLSVRNPMRIGRP